MNREKTYEVYKITNNKNGKLYVGITNQGYKTRWYKHCSDSIRECGFPLHNAIRKYGVDNFTIEVIEICESYDQLKECEKYWIKELDSNNREVGYNLTEGGDGTFGRKFSKETKEKIGKKKRREVIQYDLDGNFIAKYESVKEASKRINCGSSNICQCALGRIKSTKGFIFKYTSEKPKPVSKKKEKEPMSEEVKKRISETNKLRWTEERRENASKNNHKNKPILQYDLEGTFIKEYYNVSEATKAMSASTHTNIAKCARGERKKSCGHVWKYKE